MISNTIQPSAAPIEISNVKIERHARVANRDLILNGAGIRYKFVFEIYAIALYLEAPQAKPSEIISMPGAKRLSITLLRDIGNEIFLQAIDAGMHLNIESDGREKIKGSLQRFYEMLATLPMLKKGDTLVLDWHPEIGVVPQINGRTLSPCIVNDTIFYETLLKVWIGNSPVDEKLKQALLGEALPR